MSLIRRAVLGQFVLAWSIGVVLTVPACHAPAAPSTPAKRRPASAADRDPLSLVRAPGVSLLRGARPQPTVVFGQLAPEDARAGIHVAAATGGVVRTADGLASAIIPPGALERDTVVVLRRFATDDLPAATGYQPAMRFQLDLGGARLRADAAINVTTVLDPATTDHLTGRVAPERLAELGVSRDAGGRLSMTMPVRGPASAGPAEVGADGAPSAWAALEFGALPVPPTPTAGVRATRTLMATAGATATTEAPMRIPARMPTSPDDFFAMERNGIFGCDLSQAWCVLTALVRQKYHDEAFKPEACGVVFDEAPPPPAPTQPGVATMPAPVFVGVGPVPIAARVTWESDDPALNGRPVPGAVVRFRLPASAQTGPNEVVTDQQGGCRTFAPAGAVIFPQAISPDNRWSGDVGEQVARPGMAAIALRLPNHWPAIVLRLDSDHPLPEQAVVTYALDGLGERRITLDVKPTPDGLAVLNFPLPLPTDDQGPRAFSLLDVDLGDGREPTSLTSGFDVQRNAVYPAQAIFRTMLAPK